MMAKLVSTWVIITLWISCAYSQFKEDKTIKDCDLITSDIRKVDNQQLMSINIRYDNPKDGINQWKYRRDELVQLIQYYRPGIVGLQEAEIQQLAYIEEAMPDYGRIGVGRDDGKDKGEFCAIMYDTKVYELIDNQTFWLSDTPSEVSVGWDAAMERVCTYGVFMNLETKDTIAVFNTHFDHRGPIACMKSAKLILKKIQALPDKEHAVVVMGDLNCEPQESPIQVLGTQLKDGMSESQSGLYGPEGTFNGFKNDIVITKRIDYIFAKNVEVKSYRHIDDKKNDNNCISDHLPILIEFY